LGGETTANATRCRIACGARAAITTGEVAVVRGEAGGDLGAAFCSYAALPGVAGLCATVRIEAVVHVEELILRLCGTRLEAAGGTCIIVLWAVDEAVIELLAGGIARDHGETSIEL